MRVKQGRGTIWGRGLVAFLFTQKATKPRPQMVPRPCLIQTRHILKKCAVVSLIIFLQYNKQNRDWRDITQLRKSDIRRERDE